MPYTYLKTCPGIRTSLMCMPYMYALCVCLIRMRYMYSLRALFCFFFCFFFCAYTRCRSYWCPGIRNRLFVSGGLIQGVHHLLIFFDYILEGF